MKLLPTHNSLSLSTPDEAFDHFFHSLRPGLRLWDYFVDWEKVFLNTRTIESSLSRLNALLGREDFDTAFLQLVAEYPDVIQAIPFLVVRDGARTQEFSIIPRVEDLRIRNWTFDFSQPATTPERRSLALEFVKKTGLDQIFRANGVTNLVDYMIGVEAGLSSNGRKNRSGTAMEQVVKNYLQELCARTHLRFISQGTPARIKEYFDFEVPVDKAKRRYDFAVTDGTLLALLEVNFYSGGGSKLKATAGEYRGLHQLLAKNGHRFVWVTDGLGWEKTKKPFREAFDAIDYVWNLEWLGRDLLLEVFA